VLLSLNVRDLVLASWEIEPEQVAQALPGGLVPTEVDGRHLVSLAAFRCAGGRLGLLPVPRFSQLNVRAYAEHEGEAAVVFLGTRVTWPGMGGAVFGAPYRPARIRVWPGGVDAPGLGVQLAYEPRGSVEAGPLAEHVVGLFEAAGLRVVRIRRGVAVWQQADVVGTLRADPLAALGFDVRGVPELLYAACAAFEAQLPPKRIQPKP
jgi:uncharacterized protein YqjF (DUF2071 family)